MKWLSVIASFGLMVMLTVNTSGCKKGGGGTGAGATWGTLEQPSAVTVKQGEKATLKVDVKRSKDNTAEITIKVTPPKGITVDPTEKTLKDKVSEATFEVTAAKDASTGPSEATVTAQPGDQKHTVKITVEKK